MQQYQQYFKDPLSAGVIAAVAVAVYINYTKKGKEELPVKAYTKPAMQVGLLVAAVVYMGNGSRERIMTEPF